MKPDDSQLARPTMGDHEDEERRRVAYATHYRLWVNDERTVLVRLWDSGELEVAVRETPAHTWGPPVWLVEEKVSDRS